jgi:excisionase family DNA binding protein
MKEEPPNPDAPIRIGRPPKKLITDVEQAELLGCSRRHLFNLRRRRLIPFVKLGTSIRYDPEAVARAIEKLSIRERT